MPGPGAHMMYAMGSSLALTTVSNGRFSPHHTLTYTINAFFGPDIGSFSEWLGSLFGGPADAVGSAMATLIHHPLFYVVILGLPLCVLYSRVSSYLVHNHLLDSVSRVPLTRMQCFLLISAASFTHFFLDHLFEENGKTTTYTWILSTGWWESRAPNYPDAVIVVSILCASLIGGFFYLNRANATNSIKNKSYQSMLLILSVASLYCLWCAIQIYWISPRRPAVGEEADLGVLVFLAVYFFLPYGLCIMSMHPKELDSNQIPL
ncbi:hypothetical protein HN51_001868 [Arachis hypogaea]|uniref:Uncharacterized protein LOC107492274 isoform X2 n=2 Tax=Arachis TaxID=3817 RepID=A0A9C6TB06_ARADU|nr:uncharacterized protein LOC112695589 isoform X1 [Arachis hypogaea]XP_052113246.1 uncharacterized protein LOC107492274 isoform X2 [Arachis duranensis]QHO49989.1 uncharacterized protein DS421_1g18790 [Arachis hypogaea]